VGGRIHCSRMPTVCSKTMIAIAALFTQGPQVLRAIIRHCQVPLEPRGDVCSLVGRTWICMHGWYSLSGKPVLIQCVTPRLNEVGSSASCVIHGSIVQMLP